jgi:endonuclease V-like protein UPF0215 family
MARKKAHTPEEIVAKLRQAEDLVGQGKTVADAVRAIGVTERNAYRVSIRVCPNRGRPPESARVAFPLLMRLKTEAAEFPLMMRL